MLRCVVTSARRRPRPPPTKLLSHPLCPWLLQRSPLPGTRRPEVRSPAGELGSTEPGPDSSPLPSTCPAPRQSCPSPRAPLPPQSRGRAPLLPYLALLCCAGRRGHGPVGLAGRARARAPSPWLELLRAAGPLGLVSQPREGGSRRGPPVRRRGRGAAPRRGRAGAAGVGRGPRRPRREAPEAAGFSRPDVDASEAARDQTRGARRS